MNIVFNLLSVKKIENFFYFRNVIEFLASQTSINKIVVFSTIDIDFENKKIEQKIVEYKHNILGKILLKNKIKKEIKSKKINAVYSVDEFINISKQEFLIVTSNRKPATKNLSKLIYLIKNLDKKINCVLPLISNEYKPLNIDEKLRIQDGYADRRQYFLSSLEFCTVDNIIQLLQQFSLFKKWQHSNMKLLLFGINEGIKNDIEFKLETYKFRDDVVVLNTLTEKQIKDLIGSAYALIYFNEQESLPILPQIAAQLKVPFIVANKLINEDVFEEKVYMKCEIENLSVQMIELYKNESKRSEIIECIYETINDKNANIEFKKYLNILNN